MGSRGYLLEDSKAWSWIGRRKQIVKKRAPHRSDEHSISKAGRTARELGGDWLENCESSRQEEMRKTLTGITGVGSESKAESQRLGEHWAKCHRATFAGSGLAVGADGVGDASSSIE